MDPPKFVVVDQVFQSSHIVALETASPIPALQECHTSLGLASLLYALFSSGNQVDGLLLVANTGEDDICPEPHHNYV